MDIYFQCVTSPPKGESYTTLKIITSIDFTGPVLETMLGNSTDLAQTKTNDDDQLTENKSAQSWTKMVTQWTLPIEIK